MLNALPADLGGKHRTEPVPPEPHRLVTDVDAAREQQALDVSQGQRGSRTHIMTTRRITSGELSNPQNGSWVFL